MNEKEITTKQQLVGILYSTPKSREEIQQEVDRRNLEILKKLHKSVGEQIAMVEKAHEDQATEQVQRTAIGMLDIDLHKEMRVVERMIEEKRNQHEMCYNMYTHIEKRQNFEEQRKRCLIKKLGSKDAATIVNAMKLNQQERDEQRKKLHKTLSLS